jgi:hypothetical protein
MAQRARCRSFRLWAQEIRKGIVRGRKTIPLKAIKATVCDNKKIRLYICYRQGE